MVKEILNKTESVLRNKLRLVFNNIKHRCESEKDSSYKHYWWRWIMCEWNSFEDFYKDMIKSYKPWLQIDRINNDGNYCKKNCRWVTSKENNRNRRSNIIYQWKCLLDICKERWLIYNTIQARIASWWTIEDAIHTEKICKKKRIMWISDSWQEYIFDSVTEATISIWWSQSCISRAAKNNWYSYWYRWKYI